MRYGVIIGVLVSCIGAVVFSSIRLPTDPPQRMDGCAAIPSFLRSAPRDAALDLTQRGFRGVRMISATQPSWVLQKPSWVTVPMVASARDDRGTLYLVAAPHVRFTPSEAEAYQFLYIIDSKSGELRKFARLPIRPPHARNPFGGIGITYDCETHAVYVGHVGGSTPQNQYGGVVRITREGTVRTVMKNRDVLGVAVIRHGRRRYLYYGDARQSRLMRIRLWGDDHILTPPEEVIRFDGDTRAVALRVRREGTLRVTLAPFRYSLVTDSIAQKEYLLLRWRNGKWSTSRSSEL